jgi:hypothetical protein
MEDPKDQVRRAAEWQSSRRTWVGESEHCANESDDRQLRLAPTR